MKYLTNVILFFITSSSAHAETDVLKGQFASKWRTETCSEGSEKKDFFSKTPLNSVNTGASVERKHYKNSSRVSVKAFYYYKSNQQSVLYNL